MKRSTVRPSQTWLVWTAGFLAFPPAGLAGLAAAGGAVGSTAAALAGGAATGLVVGAGQALAARGRLPRRRWVVATAAGLALGLAVGATATGFRTGLADLALQGALTGTVLGLAQSAALPAGTSRARRALWAAATPALWALGWTVTTLAGVSVEDRFTVFGATGALAYSAVAGAVLAAVLPRREREVRS